MPARALRAPVFLGTLPGQTGRCAPPADRSFAASYSYPENKNNLPNSGRPREGLYSFNSTTEARKYTEWQASYQVVWIGSPTPLPARECCPPIGIQGGRHIYFQRRGWGGGTNSDDGHTLWYSRYTIISRRPMLWNTYIVPWPPPHTSQLRWSFRQIIYIKKPRKITVWGCFLWYQRYVKKTPRNVPVCQKIRQSMPLLT